MAKLTVSQIKQALLEVNDRSHEFLVTLANDERKSVQKLLEQCHKRIQNQELVYQEHQKRLNHEIAAYEAGYQVIAGLDEVGRGPLAGPVVVAAVVLPRDCQNLLVGVTDSKQLSHAKRLEFARQIREVALDLKIVAIPPVIIDRENIYQATRQGMKAAVEALNVKPDYLLLDAINIDSDLPQESLVKGDQRSLSIAAASIIAKVYRDELMVQYSKTYPEFGFDRNMGYGTKEHLDALDRVGYTPIHRRSFEPVKSMYKAYES